MASSTKLCCIGGVAFNRKYNLRGGALIGTSNPATRRHGHGGVIRNIAENTARLGIDLSLLSIIGDDAEGHELRDHMQSLGVDVDGFAISNDFPTAEYLAIFDDANELVLGVASMDILDQMSPDHIDAWSEQIRSSAWVILDCNLPRVTIAHIFNIKQNADFKIAIDSVSVTKAQRLPDNLSPIDYLFTNKAEAHSILGIAPNKNHDLGELASRLRERGAQNVIISDGANGHIVHAGDSVFHTPAHTVEVVNVSGAGDAMVAGFTSALIVGKPIQQASQLGARLAAMAIASPLDVADGLHPELLRWHSIQKSPNEG